jgi:hypothetical protein
MVLSTCLVCTKSQHYFGIFGLAYNMPDICEKHTTRVYRFIAPFMNSTLSFDWSFFNRMIFIFTCLLNLEQESNPIQVINYRNLMLNNFAQ